MKVTEGSTAQGAAKVGTPPMEVPTEIWLHILKYLFRCDLESVMGVNQQLMNIVLDVRFQRAIAAPCTTRRVSCFNEASYIHFHAGAPPVLHRVRELVFKDDPPVYPFPKTDNSFFVPLKQAIKRLFNPEQEKIPEYLDQLLHHVDDLWNVQAITLYFNANLGLNPDPQYPHLKYKMKAFYALASAQISNITCLSFQITLDCLVPHWQNDFVFPNLKKLTVKVQIRDQGIDTLFYPLVNNHRHSLVELVLIHSPYVSLEEMLNGIEHLPRLQVFSLSWFMQNSESQQWTISRFMGLHAAQLVDLRLRISPKRLYTWYTPDPPFDGQSVLDGCFRFKFRALRHFSLLFKSPIYNHADTIHNFLRVHETRLFSLTILPGDIYKEEAYSLDVMTHFQLDGGPFVSLSMLQDLSIYSKSLDVTLMTFLASSFPSLQYLCIYGLTKLLTEIDHIRQSKQLTGLFASWILPDMMFESTVPRFRKEEKRGVIYTFTGVTRFCGWSPWFWLSDLNGNIGDFPGSLPTVDRLAPDFFSPNMY